MRGACSGEGSVCGVQWSREGRVSVDLESSEALWWKRAGSCKCMRAHQAQRRIKVFQVRGIIFAEVWRVEIQSVHTKGN